MTSFFSFSFTEKTGYHDCRVPLAPEISEQRLWWSMMVNSIPQKIFACNYNIALWNETLISKNFNWENINFTFEQISCKKKGQGRNKLKYDGELN